MTVAVSGESGQEATRELPITVLGPLVVAEISLPAGTKGRAYAAQLVATGGDGAYMWSLESGTMPAGLSLESGGALTGTPSAGGTFAFTVRVTDGADRTATPALAITVERAPTIQTQSLPPGDVGAGYSAQLAATGGTGAYSWSITQGELPAGLTLSPAGAITGTPTTTGTATFTVQVTDEASVTHSRAFTMVVGQILSLTSGVAVTGIAGEAESVRYYSIDVPADATALTVGITGGTGDVDLYVRSELLPERRVGPSAHVVGGPTSSIPGARQPGAAGAPPDRRPLRCPRPCEPERSLPHEVADLQLEDEEGDEPTEPRGRRDHSHLCFRVHQGTRAIKADGSSYIVLLRRFTYRTTSRRFRHRTLIPPPSWIWSAMCPSASPICSSTRSTISTPLSHVVTRSPTTRMCMVFHSPMRSAVCLPGSGWMSHPRPYDS